MLRNVVFLTILICFTLAAIPGEVMADRKRLKKPSEKAKSKTAKIHNPHENRNMITGYLVVGKLTGKITEEIENNKDEILYGVGFGYERYLRPKLGLGVEFRLLWLSKMNILPDQVKSTEYRLFTVYRFNPKSSRMLYVKGGAGVTTGTMGDRANATRTQIRLAVGLISYTSGKLNTRMEISFNRMLHRSGEDLYAGITFPYAVDYVALDIGLGLPF